VNAVNADSVVNQISNIIKEHKFRGDIGAVANLIACGGKYWSGHGYFRVYLNINRSDIKGLTSGRHYRNSASAYYDIVDGSAFGTEAARNFLFQCAELGYRKQYCCNSGN
jgi:hypothetical protein